MTLWTLVHRSLRFHARAHAGVVLGAAVGSAALIGALIVGDSVRQTLKARALARLGPIHFALQTRDRFFEANLAARLSATQSSGALPSTNPAVPALDPNSFRPFSAGLTLPGVAVAQNGTARANQVNVLGVDPQAWSSLAGWSGVSDRPGPDEGGARIESSFLNSWRSGQVAFLNEALARQLSAKPGDEILLRVRKPSALGLDAALNPRDQNSVALRLKVGAIIPPEALGDFSLSAQAVAADNLFLPMDWLGEKLGFKGKANLLVTGPALRPSGTTNPNAALLPDSMAVRWLDDWVQRAWLPEDAGLSVHNLEPSQTATEGQAIRPSVEITSSRIFLDPTVISAALKPRTRSVGKHGGFQNDDSAYIALGRFVTNGVPIFTYLANLISSGDRATPYSMVTASKQPFVPGDMRDNEILVNAWLAEDLHVKGGDEIHLAYYAVDSGSTLVEHTNSFRVRGIVPLEGVYADRTLMPNFPGVAQAESTHDWDTGFPLVYKIRDQDEAYWRKFKGTPKAFITLAAGQAMWASRFGALTALRFEVPTNSYFPSTYREGIYRNLLGNLNPADVGLRFEPVRGEALQAANQSQDFGQLFLGFSLFLVVAALLLMALLFQFGLEQRATEVGTLLALGFAPGRVRRLLLAEALMLALIGGLLGAGGGILYARAMLWGLATVWHSAVGGAQLRFHVTSTTLAVGFCSSALVALLTIWLTLRKQARQPARALLTGDTLAPKSRSRSWGIWVGPVSGSGALAIVGWALAAHQTTDAEAFFSAGSLLLISGLAFAGAWLKGVQSTRTSSAMTVSALGVRAAARRPRRSLATLALLASGAFVIIAIGAFRLDANQDAGQPSSGTGGFALLGSSALPIVQDLNSQGGREFFGLNPKDLTKVKVVPFRVRQGDEASCLNLNRAQRPRLLGVNPELLSGRFTITEVAAGYDRKNGWAILRQDPAQKAGAGARDSNPGPTGPPIISAIGDANSIEWALGKKLGDTLDYTDEQGHAFKVCLVGSVANSILQGSLIIDEAEFVKRFPNESGYRMLLVDAPAGQLAQVAATLSRALQDFGLELTPAVQRLNEFNAVQNTYLGTFQVLGGLGLLLGSAGLGIVVLRNVLERRGELGLLMALGFRRRQLQWMVLAEHGALLGLGLSLGLLAAAIAVLPALLSPAAQLPYRSLAVTLGAVFLNGVIWTWAATRLALRGDLLTVLRNE